MPIKECIEDKKPGFRYGDSGKCYTVNDPEDEKALVEAKKKAIKQAIAIHGSEAHMNEAYKKIAQIIFNSHVKLNYNCPTDKKVGGEHPCSAEINPDIDNTKLIDNFIKSAAFGNIKRIWDNPPNSGDFMLDEIVKHSDIPPIVVDSKNMNDLISSGSVELFRGVTDKNESIKFKEGSFSARPGMFGNGVYATPRKDKASFYANGAKNASEKSGVIIRMTLDPSFKSVNTSDLVDKKVSFLNAIENRIANEKDTGRNHNYRIIKSIASDDGRFAAISGYDGIIIPDIQKPDKIEELVILNRSKIIVQNDDIPSYPVKYLKK